MLLSDYQSRSRATAVYPQVGDNILYPTLGLCGEAGEVAEKIKKMVRDDGGVLSDERRAALSKELGDVLCTSRRSRRRPISTSPRSRARTSRSSSAGGPHVLSGSGDDR